MKRILLTLSALFLLFLFWLFRPEPPSAPVLLPAPLPELSFTVQEARQAIHRKEERSGPLRPDNQAHIVWNESFADQKAPCSVVYLHGFSASHGEGAPLHTRVARELGCHLFLSRLHGHGLKTDSPLQNMHADSLLASASEALAIGRLLGEKVILIGTSMGGLLSLYLAAEHNDAVYALVLLSPLIDFATPISALFDRVWGQRFMKLWLRDSYLRNPPENEDHARFWYGKVHLQSLMHLKIMQSRMLSAERYSKIHQPVFAGYFYKDDEHQDDVVSVAAIKSIEDKLGTLPEKRTFMAFAESGNHVIGSAYRSANYEEVTDAVIDFLKTHFP